MDSASPLVELFNNIWGLARLPLARICNLRDNVNSLQKETEKLKTQSKDVKTAVEHEETGGGGGVQRTAEVRRWLVNVQQFEVQVNEVLGGVSEDRIRCLSRCLPWNCPSSYRLGETVEQMLNEARDLRKDGELSIPKAGEWSVLTLPSPLPVVLEMHIDDTVGLDTYFYEVWKWLVSEEHGGWIGLYGPGGVGKTTLMKMINNNLLETNPPGFEVVIWVEVSKTRHGKRHEENKEKAENIIRSAIRRRLGIEDEIWKKWRLELKVHRLMQILKKKKFLLLIDDILAKPDFSKTGVPRSPKKGSKVVFTTRSVQVCNQMGAKKNSLKVECLKHEEAQKLFEKSLGQSLTAYDQQIQDLANFFIKKCAGLPLALTVVGAAMAGITDLAGWQQSLSKLRERPHDFPGMEEVYSILQLSYDRLDNSTHQRCFLYCCLFPENYHIRRHDLIGLWIGEGLLKGTANIYNLRTEGENVFGILNRAFLLESGHDFRGDFVKMHDVIRDMATTIARGARDPEQRKKKWLMIEKQEDLSTKIGADAEIVSMWGEWIENVSQIPLECPLLKTLILRETKLSLLPIGFFDSMKDSLMVLDLSNNSGIRSFPEDVCNLIHLQYLNLSATGIQELPGAIEKLNQLQWLLLDHLKEINLISMGAIASLPLLKELSMWGSLLKEEEGMVEELRRMEHVTDLSISVTNSSSAKEIFQFVNLRKRLRRAEIFRSFDLTSIEIHQSPTGNGNFSLLETLSLFRCHLLKTVETQGIRPTPNFSYFPRLVDVEISYCGFSNLSWLLHAPTLRKLTVRNCPSLEKIIGDGFELDEPVTLRLLPCLGSINLFDLPNLTSICDQALYFQQGAKFQISNCPRLRRLPSDWKNAGGGSFTVEGDRV